MTAHPRLARALLLAGALAGIGLAASGLLAPSGPSAALPDDVVALVGGRPIGRDAYQQALTALAVDRRDGALQPDDRRRALDRLIDEELLVQRGLELGLAERDPRIRADLAGAVVALQVERGEEEAGTPSDDDLRAFYQSQADWFRQPGRVRLRALRFAVGAAARPENETAARAQEAAQRLRAGQLDAAASLSDPLPVPVPAGWVSVRALPDLIGPTPARGLEALDPGQVSEPLRGADGYWVLQLVDRQPGELPDFEAVRETVRTEYLRRAGEDALASFLQAQRSAVQVTLAAGLP